LRGDVFFRRLRAGVVFDLVRHGFGWIAIFFSKVGWKVGFDFDLLE